jgi:AcrR family transcriptional regulator
MTSTKTDAGPAPARPVRKDVARNRALLLQAADVVFAERGVEVTLDEVARHAGVGVATAYRHFDSKQALLEALFEGRIERISQRMLEAERLDDPREAFETFVYQACEMQARDRGMREVVHANHGLPTAAVFRERLEPIARRIVERAKAAGVLRPEFDVLDIPMLFVIVGGVSDYAGAIEPELWRRYLDILMDGLLAAGTARRTLSVAPLGPDQVEVAMENWHRPRSAHPIR